jgi:subtilase family serine protease
LAVLAAGSTAMLTQTAADAASSSGPKSQAVCAKPAAGHMACLSWRRTDIKPRKANAVAPIVTPGGWSPADLKSAYSIPTTLGAGTTVAIVDAYNDPNAEADLAVYRSQFGLPACTTANGCFRKVSQTGSTTSLPAADAGWAGEIALDIQMASAACPLCKILLVEANNSSTSNLGAAENYAASQPGENAISNSWGGPESS